MTNDSQATPSARTQAKQRRARHRIEAFVDTFGAPHLLLACHAAFPLALTPDMLYLLWANFQRDEHEQPLEIPWEAVADLLLSGLCEEVSYELYEMDEAIQTELLRRLKADPRFGPPRVQRLARFLQAYIQRQLDSPDPNKKTFAESQRWLALAYLDPRRTAQELAATLQSMVNKAFAATPQDRAELVRMTTLVEIMGEPLAEVAPELLPYSRGMERLARGDEEGAEQHFQQITTTKGTAVDIAGVSLPLPESSEPIDKKDEIQPITEFVIGGAMLPDHPSYIPRLADEDLLRFVLAGQLCYILAARQIGKTSLMMRTIQRLKKQQVRTALIDLSIIGWNDTSKEQWYYSFIERISTRLDLSFRLDEWWESQTKVNSIRRFDNFLRDIVLFETTEPIVIFFDEIGVALHLDFTDDFFIAIRSFYNARINDPIYRRLTFVLSGVATPEDLIQDNTRTPFNIGRAIELNDFTRQECLPFQLGLQTKYPHQGQAFFDRIYHWTDGHPYLTQKFCQTLWETDIDEGKDSEDVIDNLIRDLCIPPSSDMAQAFDWISNRIVADKSAEEMLQRYRLIWEGEPLRDRPSPAITRLKLYGLVKGERGSLKVRNNIYAQVFNNTWITKRQAEIRSAISLSTLYPRYRLLQKLGQGAYGSVYLAERPTADGSQTVALKVLELGEASEATRHERIQRFELEARVLEKLDHPNIIKIFEANSSEANQSQSLYIAMEYIAGGSLRDELTQIGTIPPGKAVTIISAIGDALKHTHESGIIHRDVQPNNILIDKTHDPIRYVLTDFGLVKLLSPDEGMPSIKSIGPVGGIPYYMSQDQFDETSEPTPAMDIYALAVTFFEMLAGERLKKPLGGPLPVLSEIKPDIGTFFDETLIKATTHNAPDGYQTMAEFVAAVEAANEQAKLAEQGIAVSTDPSNGIDKAFQLELNPSTLQVIVRWQGNTAETTFQRPSLFELLKLLNTSPGRVYSKDEIIATLYPDDNPLGITDDAIFQQISRLRKSLDPLIQQIYPSITESCIQNVRGIGYKLVVDLFSLIFP